MPHLNSLWIWIFYFLLNLCLSFQRTEGISKKKTNIEGQGYSTAKGFSKRILKPYPHAWLKVMLWVCVGMYMTSHPARFGHKDNFMAETSHESRLMRSRSKKYLTRSNSPVGTPQTPSNKLNPAKQVKPWGRFSPPWNQVFKGQLSTWHESQMGQHRGKRWSVWVCMVRVD